MAFSIIGPGIRDEIKLDNLFKEKIIEPVNGTVPIRHVEKSVPVEERLHYGRDRLRYAYEEGSGAKPYKELVAEQLMSSPVMTLSLKTTIPDAWKFFREHRFRHVPVVDDTGHLQGIVSDRDLLSVLEKYMPTGGMHAAGALDSIMQTRVLTATTNTVISQIAAVFFRQRIGAMPIMRDDVLVGIITRSDILGAVVYSSQVESWA
ncbi:MAG: CBS domain-containing protein [Gammaproteobacteria bacterium]|nr:CBS domain-containing protein [Gammaproteobacteria bacterium]